MKKIMKREVGILLGFIASFLAGLALARTAFNSSVAPTLILIGLYGYPFFVIIRYVVRTFKVFKSLDATAQRKRITIIILSGVGLYLAVFIQNYMLNQLPEKRCA